MRLPKHSMSPARRSRSGFSLVELMIVLAIIAVVVSLAASASMQVITRQKATNTELTIQKINDALKAHWRAVIEQAKNEPIPDNILSSLLVMASGDPRNVDPNNVETRRRAQLIWTKLRLKQQFPMNFTEA